MKSQRLKVGELAAKTGLSVRTLHHYDEIGLLTPSERTGSGHRLYGASDVIRLQRIVSLRQLGFALDRISELLDGDDFSPRELIRMHLTQLREQIDARQRLCQRLERVSAALDADQEPTLGDFLELIKEIELMDKVESHYTPEQLETLRRRREAAGEERMREVQEEWKAVFAGFREEMEKGTDPSDEAVQHWVRKSADLIAEFTGGDPGIARSLGNVHRENPNLLNDFGYNVDAQLNDYMRQAREAQ